METRRQRSLSFCRWLPSAILLSAIFFIGSLFMVMDYKQSRCRPDGARLLPRGIISSTTDLEMLPLRGPPRKKKSRCPTNLLAVAVGIKHKKNVNEIVKKFALTDFALMLFHYDGTLDGWNDLEWSKKAIHVSAINQTKWWFAKRFLHPDVVAHYDYIFLWDEDLGVENFHAQRYLSVIKEEGLHVSQPAINPAKSHVHYKPTAEKATSNVHGFTEMMAPVFSKTSWRCAWYMIQQNDMDFPLGLSYQLGHCAQGNKTTNIGIVDTEYLVQRDLPTFGGSAAKEVP
ncbi:hypothetical protein F511_04794 [Dorcoceras hygrometricum]|uniref:Uncharacterized protein n=1 Tax=Dorcoceras hygrometricum TaxID=472368 RepID=A0A2Z7AW74_9LAMI|nr:hypothetical protein F511_04794 [Dorcoceras hygrometricum]